MIVVYHGKSGIHAGQGLAENRKEQSGSFPSLSSQVGMTGFEPAL